MGMPTLWRHNAGNCGLYHKQGETYYYIYILDSSGRPLTPTTRYGKVHRMFKSVQAGRYARSPSQCLTYGPATKVTQNVTIGDGPSRTNIGMAAVVGSERCLYSTKCETRRKQVTKLIAEWAMHRRASRRGRCLAWKRLANKNPSIQLQYQKGPLYGSIQEAVKDIQEPVYCTEPAASGMTITPCHGTKRQQTLRQHGWALRKLPHQGSHQSKLAKIKADQNKKYHALFVLNQIMPHLLKALEARFPGQTYVIYMLILNTAQAGTRKCKGFFHSCLQFWK